MTDVILGERSLELIAGEIVFREANGETITFSVKDGNLSLGGQGRDGDLLIRDTDDHVTIALNGSRGALHLGGPGQDGDITVRDAEFEQSAHLDGRTGDLELRGEVTCRSLQQLSDARLKHDVTPIDGALEAVMALTGVRYRFEEGAPRLGVLAQDVAAAAPEAARETDAGMTVDHAALTGLLIEAVKALRAEIDTLKARL